MNEIRTHHAPSIWLLLSALCCGIGCSQAEDALGSADPVSILPDGVTFQDGDGAHFVCVIEIPGWGVPVGTPVLLGFVPNQFYAGQTHPPDPFNLGPYITFDPLKVNAMPVPAQVFLFGHECGHVNSGLFLSEVAANCWGAKRIRSQGLLTPAEWDVVRDFLVSVYPVATGPYPSGVEQWNLMQNPACAP